MRAVEVVVAVVARAPDLLQVVAVLDRARQVCADRRERAQLTPGSRTTMAGSAPKGTRRPLLGRSDEALPALTVSEVASGTSGGLRNRSIG